MTVIPEYLPSALPAGSSPILAFSDKVAVPVNEVVGRVTVPVNVGEAVGCTPKAVLASAAVAEPVPQLATETGTGIDDFKNAELPISNKINQIEHKE